MPQQLLRHGTEGRGAFAHPVRAHDHRFALVVFDQLDERAPDDGSVSAKAPLPALGLIGRVYPVKNVSLTAEVTGFKLPKFDEDYDGNYVDIDVYGTVNFTHHFGVQAGWRRMQTYLKIEDNKGDFRFQGVWFGGALRF